MSALGELWHVGVVVPDLDDAMTGLTEGFGLDWTSVNAQRVAVTVGERTECHAVRWAASRGERPDLEVIEAGEGIWSQAANGGAALHHLAYWSRDLEADVARLTALGYRLEASGTDEAGRLRFVYLLGPAGLRIELGSEHTRAAWEEWVGGGDYGLGIA